MNTRAVASSLVLSLMPAACIMVLDDEGHLRHRQFASGKTIRGSGVSRTEERTAADFQRIVVEGSPDVSVRVGEPKAVSVSGDDNLVSWVTTEVRDGTLRIGMKSGSHSSRVRLEVAVAVPSLESVQVQGSSDVGVTGLAGDSFEIRIQGSGDVQAAGKVARLDASISGSGDMKLAGLEAREARVSISGSGDVDLWATETLVVSIAGSGDVSYRGDPKLTKSVAGSGDVSRR